MISKELFVEVMGKEKMYCVLNIDTGELDVEEFYNIHELAHKVKEWALNQGYSISSDNGNDEEDLACAIVYKPQDGGIYTFYEDYQNTEPEAIFKAGQWILENR